MGYSSVAECDLIIAQALTTGKPDSVPGQLTKLINIGNTRDLNRIPDETVEYYITLADSQIDGISFQQYFTPFDKCANGQWDLDEDINAPIPGGTDAGTDSAGIPFSVLLDETTGTSSTVIVNSSVNLVPGDEIILHDDLNGNEEIVIVGEIVDQNTFTTVSPIEGTFLADNGVRVIRIQFPPPLNQISARYAASFIYDKYFAAQAQPDMSDFGKELRSVAMGQLNDMLNGKVIIKCGRRKGDHFGNPWIDSSYTHRKPYDGYNTTDRDMSKPQ